MGTWSETWPLSMVGSGNPFTIWAWVAAEGYVTAVVTDTISLDTSTPGNGTPGNGTKVTAADRTGYGHEAFGSLEAAQAYLTPLGIAMNSPRYLPEGFTLEHVKVDRVNYEGANWSEVRQVYKMTVSNGKDGSEDSGGTPSALRETSLQLIQTNNFGNSMGDFGPENPEFRDAAQRLTVAQHEIYTMQRFGLWMLVWRTGDTIFEMEAPVSAMPLEKLLEIAGSVDP